MISRIKEYRSDKCKCFSLQNSCHFWEFRTLFFHYMQPCLLLSKLTGICLISKKTYEVSNEQNFFLSLPNQKESGLQQIEIYFYGLILLCWVLQRDGNFCNFVSNLLCINFLPGNMRKKKKSRLKRNRRKKPTNTLYFPPCVSIQKVILKVYTISVFICLLSIYKRKTMSVSG